jgi:uncharacterized protein (TIGR03437 family)
MTRALFFFAFSAYAAGNAIPNGFLNHPLAFEPNRGQAAPQVRFVAHGNSRDYLLSASGVTVTGASLHFASANNEPQAMPLDPLAERHNYFHGPISQTDISTYRRVRYSRLYPGIDCVFYGDQKGLEFDFEISPGSDPGQIRFGWQNAKGVRLDANGELVIETVSGELRQRKPTVYQERSGLRILIDGAYLLSADGEIRFSLGRYDRTRPVIIDPVLFALDESFISVTAMAADPAGSVYLTGSTQASVLPTTAGAFQPAYAGGACESFVLGSVDSVTLFQYPDAFVTKLDSRGQIVYVTYLGGNGNDIGNAVAADASGNAYVAGGTRMSSSGTNNFPTTPQAAFPNPSALGGDGFITKLNPAGSQLLYSTYIPELAVIGIALDAQGNTYFAGFAGYPPGAPFPVTPGAFQTSSPVGTGLVAKLNAAGSALVYATYLGGSGSVTSGVGGIIRGIAVDASGVAYVTGNSASPNFPTTPGAFQTEPPDIYGAAYVAKIAPSGASLIYSTFLGSGGGDLIRVDAQGNAIVLGTTMSLSFPVTPGAFELNGLSTPWTGITFNTAFLSKLNPTGSALVYSTYIAGGSTLDIDNAGDAYVLGAASYGFPTTAGAYQPCSHGPSNIFAAEFGPDGTLSGATYLGGSGTDTPTGIVALGGGSVYLAGTTDSPDFPGIDLGPANLVFVGSLLINDPNHLSGPCLAYAIQNGATFFEGPIAPGEIVTLRGTNIGPQEPAYQQIGPDGKVSTELAGVQVYFDIYKAPLLYVQSQQINAIVPWEVANLPLGGIGVLAQYEGASSNVSRIVPVPSAPGIFLNSMFQAAVLNADGTLNSPSNPARQGTVITFFGTGGGVTNPPGVTGGFWPSSPLAQLTLPVSVLINGVDAYVIYAGSAPGMVSGIFQINVRVPSPLPPSPGTIVVMIGGASSRAALFEME